MTAVPENQYADGHNEGSCALCTGWHDAEEAAFMNRRREEGIADVEPLRMTPPVVLIRWRDSLTGPVGWASVDEVKADAVEAFSGPLSAAGFLVADEKTHLVLATGYNPHTDEVTGSMMVPRSEVVSMDELRPAEEPSE